MREQSHDESFLAILTQRFGGLGLYILDEPEAALSPWRQLAVLSRIHDLIQDNSQFIIATHSPILMAYPDACICQCGKTNFSKITYKDTEHFQVTRDFLSNPPCRLKVLMEH